MTLRFPHPDSDKWLWLIAAAIVCLFIVASCVRADDEEKPEVTTPGTPSLYIGCNRYSPAWKRVRNDVSRDEWICDAFNVTLEDRPEFREPMIRFSNHDTWKPWPKPAECRTSPFATSGMATIWIRPELESYASGLAYRHYWEPPFPVLPVIAPADDHVAPVPEGDAPKPE